MAVIDHVKPAPLGRGARLRARLALSSVGATLAVALAALIVPAAVFLVQSSLYETNFDGSFGDFTWRYYAEVFANDRFLQNLINATLYACGSAAVAITLGITQAWIVERTNTPGRNLVFIISIISLGIPSVLYTVSFLLLLGKTGPLNQFLMWATGASTPLFNIYSLWGMVIVEGIEFAPLSFLLLSSVFRSNDAAFEEASMMSGAGIATTFRRITLRLAMPGILALLILIFIRAFESFETPALVGRPGGVSVLTTDIYAAVALEIPANYGQAGAFSVMLLFIVVGLLYGYNRLSRHAEKFQTITGKGFRPRVMDLGRWRWLTAGVLVLFFFIIIGFPVGIVMWVSFLPYYDGIHAGALKLMSLANYRTVIHGGLFQDSLANTLILGAACASIVAPVTALCAWLAVRRQRGGQLLDQLASAPLIFPAIVMGVAYLQVFLQVPLIYGTLLSIIIASMVRYLPYGMRYSYAGILQIHKELEEASALSGARQATTFRRVVMPLVAPALATCWLFVFLVAVKAVSIPILLAGPKSRVIAVTIFDLWENGVVGELSAMGIIWTAMMTVVSILFSLLARRYGLNLR
ncbi:MAG: ABC transporter permease subunit [Alphaproteobacteria bacterium]|nr:ABC transporter permease subunit [Alphaproteobacteria bacterium]